jgi:hypothetical protein
LRVPPMIFSPMSAMSAACMRPHRYPPRLARDSFPLQIAAGCSNVVWLETMVTDVPWRHEIATESATPDRGMMLISDTPGLGIEIHEVGFRSENCFATGDVRRSGR